VSSVRSRRSLEGRRLRGDSTLKHFLAAAASWSKSSRARFGWILRLSSSSSSSPPTPCRRRPSAIRHVQPPRRLRTTRLRGFAARARGRRPVHTNPDLSSGVPTARLAHWPRTAIATTREARGDPGISRRRRTTRSCREDTRIIRQTLALRTCDSARRRTRRPLTASLWSTAASRRQHRPPTSVGYPVLSSSPGSATGPVVRAPPSTVPWLMSMRAATTPSSASRPLHRSSPHSAGGRVPSLTLGELTPSGVHEPRPRSRSSYS